MKNLSLAAFAATMLISASASAHISVASGPGFANVSQKITFGITHGCNGADTLKIKVSIPAGVTGVRALYSDFGKPSVEKDASNNVTAVTWQKADADLQAEDIGFYELTIRARLPNAPFSRLQFNVEQTCRTAAGVVEVTHWDQPPGATTGEPAPLVTVVPARQPGWNKYVLPANIAAADVPMYFGDALIAWRGAAAYSSNANTVAQITATPGVTMLGGDLAANDEIWVRY
ncbi:MAG: DUF1775 domain-containing protein [Deltaproteobacteria bacterium]|nr:DUF1775 domain-containing protein [Deltaproteobacteria bacterium]MCW5804459.1 DUF1775 domain-containing protein [Deltaproteobacteria bacterium]